jgi:hypothetical protein
MASILDCEQSVQLFFVESGLTGALVLDRWDIHVSKLDRGCRLLLPYFLKLGTGPQQGIDNPFVNYMTIGSLRFLISSRRDRYH